MKSKPIVLGAVALLLAGGLMSYWFSDSEVPRTGSDDPAKTVDAGSVSSAGKQSAPLEKAAAEQGRQLVQEICGPNAYHRLRELADREQLSPSECEALSEFLVETTTDEKLERMASIKNSVMNVLASQEHLPTPWDQLLQKIYQDDFQHPVIRDYALQHLFEYYEKLLRQGIETLDPTRESELLALFWKALDQKRESYSGTALLGLFHLSEVEPGIDLGRLAFHSLEMIQSPDTGELARISAFQVASLLDEPGTLPLAKIEAHQGENLPVRVSAIAAIGMVGSKDEVPFLKKILQEKNSSIHVAGSIAIAKIQTRNQQISR